MLKHPLAEIFGFPPDNLSPEAERYRRNRLCPYQNPRPKAPIFKYGDMGQANESRLQPQSKTFANCPAFKNGNKS